eukprot:jgi/Tetstr1/427807/TSEL_001779.t1
MKDYERRVFEATVASSAKATATARVGGSGCMTRAWTWAWRRSRAWPRGKRSVQTSWDSGRTLDLLSISLSAQTLKSYAGRLSQFAEFCHESENISPLEATTAT